MTFFLGRAQEGLNRANGRNPLKSGQERKGGSEAQRRHVTFVTLLYPCRQNERTRVTVMLPARHGRVTAGWLHGDKARRVAPVSGDCDAAEPDSFVGD